LLANHIATQEPTVNLVLISKWPKDGPNWNEKLIEKGFKNDGPNIIIIDEAQLTYWDIGFWNSFLKQIIPISSNRVILFASYGSPTGTVTEDGTPMIIPDHSRVDLRPIDHGDGITPAGLFLTTDEFADVVGKRDPKQRFEKEFLDYVFRVTAGHVGAVTDLLWIVSAHDVSLHIKLQHSLTIISSHTVNSSMMTTSTRRPSLRVNFLSRTYGRVSKGAVYSDVGSPTLMTSRSRTSLEFSVQCLRTIM
jgi:hypothetical protein